MTLLLGFGAHAADSLNGAPDGGALVPAPARGLRVALRRIRSESPTYPATLFAQTFRAALTSALAEQTPPGELLGPASQPLPEAIVDVRISQTNVTSQGGSGSNTRYRFTFTVGLSSLPPELVAFEQRTPTVGAKGARTMADAVVETLVALSKRRQALLAAREQPVSAPEQMATDNVPGAEVEPESGGVAGGVSAEEAAVKPEGLVQIYLAQPWSDAPRPAVTRELLAQVGLQGELGKRAEALVELRARADEALPYRNQFGLWEARVRGDFGPISLIAGRQIFDWGPPNGPADRLCPRDMSEPFRVEKQPILAVRAIARMEPFSLEAVVVPEWRPTILPWYADRERVQLSAFDQRSPWFPGPEFYADAQPTRIVFDDATVGPRNSVVGARAAFQGELVSAGLGVHYGADSAPLVYSTQDNGQALVHVAPQRFRVFHGDVGIHPGSWTFNLMAAAALTDSFFLGVPESSTRADLSTASFSAEVGRADWRLTDKLRLDLYANYYLDTVILKRNGSYSLSTRPVADTGNDEIDVSGPLQLHAAAAQAELTVADRVKLTLVGFAEVNLIGAMGSFGMSYLWGEATSVTAQVEVYRGRPEQALGVLGSKNDRITLIVRHSFGGQ